MRGRIQKSDFVLIMPEFMKVKVHYWINLLIEMYLWARSKLIQRSFLNILNECLLNPSLPLYLMLTQHIAFFK